MDAGTVASDRGGAAAAALLGAWGAYGDRFLDVTRRARVRFERRDWKGAQDDAARRLDLYGDAIRQALGAIEALGGDDAGSRPFWTSVRSAFAARTEGRPDQELARTFFNSVVRRVFHTVGVDPAVEFVAPREAEPLPTPPFTATTRIDAHGSWDALARRLTDRLRFACGWEDADRDALAIADDLRQQARGHMPEGLEIVRSIFYRSKGAYVVGRLDTHRGAFPFLLALANPRGRVVADAVLLDENEISIVFSFARSYFLVEYERPRELVAFLLSLMPRKPVAEVYNAIGANRHGKTELYRSLLHHLDTSSDRFVIAPGQRGMVMCVFVLEGFDVVFKVIRDRFDPPKTADRAEVMSKYRLVFRRDRAGRLVDAQEFEHLEFDRARFEPGLLEELLDRCSETVEVRDDRVVVRHLYTERRMRPLDLHLRESDPETAIRDVLDYGQSLKDLAATNVFPGDMLLKNFGVTRHGRVIFYDYDELALLTDCVFRSLPAASDPGDEGGEPWFYVGDRDIFPEEFRGFLGLRGEPLEAFLATHGDLLDPAWWRRMQELILAGEVIDIWPYGPERRLRLPDGRFSGDDEPDTRSPTP